MERLAPDRAADHAALLAEAEAELAAVDDALHRLDAGHYGTCEACGERLPDALLEADPFARSCPTCSTTSSGPAGSTTATASPSSTTPTPGPGAPAPGPS